jgi:DNA-binding transcriptional ArsR family regulator
MNAHGRPVLDQRLVTAVGHPLRVAILEALHGRALSPKQLAPEVGSTLNLTSYHVKVLREVGAIRLVKAVPRRGAKEHFYTAQPRALIGHQDWRSAPLAVRPGVSNEAVRAFIDRIGDAIDAGTLDRHEDTTLNWMPITVDQQGWQDLARLLRRTNEFVMEIHDRSLERLGDAEGMPVVTGLAAFEAPPPDRSAPAPDE